MLGPRAGDPLERAPHIVELRGKARLAAEPVVRCDDREPGCRDAVERIGVGEQRRELASGAAQPAAAVKLHDDGKRARGLVRQVQVERQRPEPGVGSERDVADHPAHAFILVDRRLSP